MKENFLSKPNRLKMQKPRALLSVYDKEGLEPLAKALTLAGYDVVSSGGTASFLQSCGVRVTPIESVTGNPEVFEGRMKTISFQVESAILFDRNNRTHRDEAKSLDLVPIDIVVCNFYPFEKSLEEKLDLAKAIDLIDIGGPTMVRAAAKNYQHVLVLVDPQDYPKIIQYLAAKQEIPKTERLALAAKAFQKTADYDSQIDTYFQQQLNEQIIRFRFRGGEKLRYGENPHQEGYVFWSTGSMGNDPLALCNFTKVSGKALSFNNLLDIDAAVNALSNLGGNKPACVIVKHANPCGAATGKTIEEAFQRSWDGDPVAAFGGIVVLNRPLTEALLNDFLEEKKFVEVFAAPTIEKNALIKLVEKKKNLILMVNSALTHPVVKAEMDIKKIRGGLLMQQSDSLVLEKDKLEVVSKRLPSPEEWDDLLFAWKITKESKSNSITLVRGEQLVGAAAGQQDRVRSCKLAVEKAGERSTGASAASDGFFPFSDGPLVLIKAGVTAILHPGGSIRDQETIDVCNQHNVSLVTTRGIRAFKH